MLKKIIAIFLSLTFLTSMIMIHSVLQKPEPVQAAQTITYRTWQSLHGQYILVPYSFAQSQLDFIGGLYYIEYISANSAVYWHAIQAPQNRAQPYFSPNFGIHTTSGSGTTTDPYRVLGL